MARQFIYHMAGLNKAFGSKKILENIHLSFYPDAKIGILGPNGAGKSTVLRIMAGLDKEFTGEAWLAEGATVGYLPQEPELDPALDVMGNVMEGVSEKKAILDRYNELMMNYSDETAEEGAKLQDIIDSQNLWDLDSQIEMAMEALGCPPGDASVDKLSGGEKRRVALCQLLLRQPDLLLLDEPTNHLDAETTAWLEKHLREYPGSVLIITHDRYFLDNVTGWILELDRGRGIPYEGNYSAYLEKKAKRMAQEGREEATRQKALEREREWIASSPKARQAKSKARFRAYDELVKSAAERRPGDAQIVIPTGERLGQQVIEIEGLSKGYGDRLLIDDLSFKLPPGGIVGVIGPNGAGKTTLFRMITGQETPDSGAIRTGETVKLSYVDQSRDTLDPNKTVWEEISGGNDVIADKFDISLNAMTWAGRIGLVKHQRDDAGGGLGKPVGVESTIVDCLDDSRMGSIGVQRHQQDVGTRAERADGGVTGVVPLGDRCHVQRVGDHDSVETDLVPKYPDDLGRQR
jgi:ATP-binding cassette ChvD family protein